MSNDVTHVAMKRTGVYWKPVYKVLEDLIPNAGIVNAHHIKNVLGHKTDKMDSEWICKSFLQVFSNQAIFLSRNSVSFVT